MKLAIPKWWRDRRKEPSCVEQGDALCVPALITTPGLVTAVYFAAVLSPLFWRDELRSMGPRYWVILALALLIAILLADGLDRYFFPFGLPLIQVDADALRLRSWRLGWLGWLRWRWSIKVKLPLLRAVSVQTLPPPPFYKFSEFCARWRIRCTLADGSVKTVHVVPFVPGMKDAVADFLRRKLPPSVQLTVDGQAPVV